MLTYSPELTDHRLVCVSLGFFVNFALLSESECASADDFILLIFHCMFYREEGRVHNKMNPLFKSHVLKPMSE